MKTFSAKNSKTNRKRPFAELNKTKTSELFDNTEKDEDEEEMIKMVKLESLQEYSIENNLIKVKYQKSKDCHSDFKTTGLI